MARTKKGQILLVSQIYEYMGFHYEVCIGRQLTATDARPVFNVGREVIRSFGIYHFVAAFAISGYLLVKRDKVSQSVMVRLITNSFLPLGSLRRLD